MDENWLSEEEAVGCASLKESTKASALVRILINLLRFCDGRIDSLNAKLTKL